MTQTATQTVQPRLDRPVIHLVEDLGHATMYDRHTASTRCGRRLSGYLGNIPAKATCAACKDAGA